MPGTSRDSRPTPGGDTLDAREEVEARAAAPGGPLAICLGSSTRERVTVRTGAEERCVCHWARTGAAFARSRAIPLQSIGRRGGVMSVADYVRRTSEKRLSLAQATSGERLLGERLLVDSDFARFGRYLRTHANANVIAITKSR